MSFYVLDEDEDAGEEIGTDWTPWNGGENPPVDPTTRVDVIFRSGTSYNGTPASRWDWKHGGVISDIVSWRLHDGSIGDASPITSKEWPSSSTKSAPKIDMNMIGRSIAPETQGDWKAWSGRPDNEDLPPDELNEYDMVQVVYRDGESSTLVHPNDTAWHLDPPGTDAHQRDVVWYRIVKGGVIATPPGWKEWKGLEKDMTGVVIPSGLKDDTKVRVLFRNGDVDNDTTAGYFGWDRSTEEEYEEDIIAYSVISEEDREVSVVPEGFIKWDGHNIPPNFQKGLVLFRSGSVAYADERSIKHMRWSHSGDSGDIMAYRAQIDGEIYVRDRNTSVEIADALDAFVKKYGKFHPKEAEILSGISKMVFKRRNG